MDSLLPLVCHNCAGVKCGMDTLCAPISSMAVSTRLVSFFNALWPRGRMWKVPGAGETGAIIPCNKCQTRMRYTNENG